MWASWTRDPKFFDIETTTSFVQFYDFPKQSFIISFILYLFPFFIPNSSRSIISSPSTPNSSTLDSSFYIQRLDISQVRLDLLTYRHLG